MEASISRQTPGDQYAYGYFWHVLPKAGGGAVPVPVDGFLAVGEGAQVIAAFPDLQLVVVATSGNFPMQRPHILLGVLENVLPAVLGDGRPGRPDRNRD